MSTPTVTKRRLRAEPLTTIRSWTIAATFGLTAMVVCASGSWIPSLWGDEAATLLSARRPLPSLLQMLTHVDAVHGLYYLGMHGWIRLAGESPFALRLPSAVAVGLAVAAITLLAGRRGGPTAAIAAGIAGCVLPRLCYAGEEARPYAMSAAAAAWLTLLLVWLVGGGRRLPDRVRRYCWAGYGAGMAVAAYLFLYSATLLAAHLGILLLAQAGRRTLRAWALAAGGALLAVAPLAALAFLERGQIAYLGLRGDTAGSVLWQPWFGTPAVAVVAWAFILLAIGAAVHRRSRAGGPLRVSATLVGVCWLVLPTGALLAADAISPLYTARYSTFAAPAAALLVAEGTLVLGRLVAHRTAMPAIAASGAGLLAVVAMCTPVYLSQRGPYSKNNSDWAEVSAAVSAVARQGDAIVFDESTRPSRRPRLAMRAYPEGFAAVRDVTLRVPYDRNIGWADRVYSIPEAAGLGRFDGVHRVWLVEDDVDGALDSDRVADLEALGFEETGLRVPTHRTMLIELAR